MKAINTILLAILLTIVPAFAGDLTVDNLTVSNNATIFGNLNFSYEVTSTNGSEGTFTSKYFYVGTDQHWTNTAGHDVTVTIKMWGAGGGGDGYYCLGGAGGYASGSLVVSNMGVLKIIVGGGGNITTTNRAYGGGGAGKGDNWNPGGGGRSAVRLNEVEKITAGGGGGGVWAIPAYGGAGGGSSGLDGGDGGYKQGDFQGRGGSQSAGGAGGGGSYPGNAGQAYQGGDVNISGGIGGGGGGGYYGGGSGGWTSGDQGSGGGGAGYIGGVFSATTTAGGTNGIPYINDIDYIAGIGYGGLGVSGGIAGSNGLVIIKYQTTNQVSSSNITTLSISSNGINQASASGTNVFLSKVGIGTNTPAEKLHVAGNFRVDGTNIVSSIALGGETRTNWPSGAQGALMASNNLSDVSNASAARANLGLGSAATNDASVFLTPTGNGSQLTNITATQVGAVSTNAGALLAANNLSDLANASAARANLGLGSAATNPASAFLAPTGNGSQLTGITASQVGALSTNGGVVNGNININGSISVNAPAGDIPMGVYTNQ